MTALDRLPAFWTCQSGGVLYFDFEGAQARRAHGCGRGDRLTVRATAFGHDAQTPLSSMEIVVHGSVVGRVTAADDGQSREQLSIELDLPVEKGMWIAARAAAGPMQVAHTSPVYVTVDGGGFHDAAALDSLLHQSAAHLSELEHVLDHPHEHVEHQVWRHREGLMERIDTTRAVIERMRRRD